MSKIFKWKVIQMYLVDIARWPFLMIFCLLTYLLFFIFNRTSIINRSNVPRGTNVIYASRHITFVDTLLVTVSAMHLKDFFCPWLMPWHTAAEEYCKRNRLLAILSWMTKIISIKREQIVPANLRRMIFVTKYSRLFIFPAGTRERFGKKINPKIGIGHVAYATKATIIPVWIEGLDDVLPIDAKWLSFGKKIKIVFGKPVDYENLLDISDTKTAKTAIALRATEAIYSLSDAPTPEIIGSKQA